MRLNTVEEIKKYEGKDSLQLVTDSDLFKIKVQMHNLVTNGNVRELADDEFTWVYASQPIGVRHSYLSDVGVFTELEDARNYMQERLNNTVLEEDPSGETVDIYKGGYCFGMERIDKEQFDWTVDAGYEGVECRSIKLNEIYRQAIKKGLIKEGEMLTVFDTSPTHGSIYQCGNYGTGDWAKMGETRGYA